MALRLFSVTYTLITLLFIHNIYADQSASLGYAFIFPTFWGAGILILLSLYYKKIIKIESVTDKVFLTFATPVPALVFFMIGYSVSDNPSSTYEYNRDGHRHREITYSYTNGQYKRKEFYISKDKVSETNPFPLSDVWLKDSTWLYFDKDGTVYKEERY